MGGVNRQCCAIYHADLCTHTLKDFGNYCNITDTWNIFYRKLTVCKDNGWKNSCNRIFCATDGYFAFQASASMNEILFQIQTLLTPAAPFPQSKASAEKGGSSVLLNRGENRQRAFCGPSPAPGPSGPNMFCPKCMLCVSVVVILPKNV